MSIPTIDLETLAAKAKAAKYAMAALPVKKKNQALKAIGQAVTEAEDVILEANRQDLLLAKAAGLSASMLERLSLQQRFKELLADLDTLTSHPDPTGRYFESRTLPNGLQISKMRTPIGVLGVIYESRPNVTLDVSLLAIKSGNCALLRGGSETLQTNKAIVAAIQKALHQEGLPKEAIQLIESTDRALVERLLKLHQMVDLIIPRGSNTLQQFCREHSTIPVITGGIGICHIYVDESADRLKALEVITNAKTRRPTVCNALDTLLVHESIAKQFLPELIGKLQPLGVHFKLDEKACQIFEPSLPTCCALAESSDWETEWLSLNLGIKVVCCLEEAIEHIREHSTQHSDAILTENQMQASRFVHEVDSAAVYVNAPTCFTDGGQFGLGGEVAISTQKLHARGPMGLEELTSYKWVIHGNYQTRN